MYTNFLNYGQTDKKNLFFVIESGANQARNTSPKPSLIPKREETGLEKPNFHNRSVNDLRCTSILAAA